MQEWHWLFWFLTVLANGFVSGFMVCYGLFLARFLRSADAAGVYDVFQQYRAFRQRMLGFGFRVLFSFIIMQIIGGVLFFVTAWRQGGSVIISAIAGFAGAAWYLLYLVSGFGRQEHIVLKSATTPSSEEIHRFLERNVALHIVFGFISFVGFLAALTVSIL